MRELLAALAESYLPQAIVIPLAAGAVQQALAARLPFAGGMSLRGGRPAAYVCRDFACRQPVTTADDLRRELDAG